MPSQVKHIDETTSDPTWSPGIQLYWYWCVCLFRGAPVGNSARLGVKQSFSSYAKRAAGSNSPAVLHTRAVAGSLKRRIEINLALDLDSRYDMIVTNAS